MIRKFILVVVLICFGFNANSQIGSVIDNTERYSKPKTVKKEVTFSTKQLAYSITKNSISDSEKALEIYRWITKNISYDNELMRSQKLQKQIYTSEENVVRNVLKRKMALCGGFALLFNNLCADVGIEAKEVHGYTKDFAGRFKKRKTPHHTWNVVKLNGKWQLIDITWAVSHGDGKTPDNFWYLTRPEDFIYSHYPEDIKWTLLNNPISYSDFKNTKH